MQSHHRPTLFTQLVALFLVLAAISMRAPLAQAEDTPGFVQLQGGPFQRTYLVNTRSFGDDGEVEAYLIFQKGEKDMVGPEGQLHYVEHLSWLNAIGNNRLGTGGDSNAWTDKSSIGYWLSGPKDKLKENLGILSHVFDPISLPTDFALQERDIIQREYDYRIGNNHDAQIEEILDKMLYEGNGLARSPMGQKSEIAQFELSQALAIHNSTHNASNAILVVVGDITMAEVRMALPSLKSAAAITPPIQALVMASPTTQTTTFPDVPLSPKIIWRRIVEMPQPSQYSLLDQRCQLLKEVLLANLPGSLTKSLRYDNFFARSFDLSIQAIDDRHVELRFSGYPDKNIKLVDLQSAFEKTLSQSASNGIPQDTFDRVKARVIKDLPKTNQDSALSEWAKKKVIQYISAGHIPPALAEVKKLESDLTVSSIDSILRMIVGQGRTAVAFVGKE